MIRFGSRQRRDTEGISKRQKIVNKIPSMLELLLLISTLMKIELVNLELEREIYSAVFALLEMVEKKSTTEIKSFLSLFSRCLVNSFSVDFESLCKLVSFS